MNHNSPIKKYPGYIVLPDYFGWDELIEWDDNIMRAGEEKRIIPQKKYHAKAALSVVQEWHIEGLPEKPEKLPANISGVQLVTWIIGLVNDMINEDETPSPFLSSESGDA